MERVLDRGTIRRSHERLAGILAPEQIHADEEMSAHTTFKVGGAADLFVEIDSIEELSRVLSALRAEGIAQFGQGLYLIGNGSNLLVSDSGIRGVVLHLSKEFGQIEAKGDVLICGAGATLAGIAHCAWEHGLTGMEFAAGIPGSLGGAIVMNAGAYGGEMKHIVRSVSLMAPDGTVFEKRGEEMDFSYRHSLVKDQPLIVLGAALALEPGDPDAIRARMDELMAKRREKQPLEYPSAGSTFKRPEGHFAARLIEEAGLRGFSVGGAQVSQKHCGFVVNKENATAEDVHTLIKEVQERVERSSGVRLEPEVILLGFHA